VEFESEVATCALDLTTFETCSELGVGRNTPRLPNRFLLTQYTQNACFRESIAFGFDCLLRCGWSKTQDSTLFSQYLQMMRKRILTLRRGH
ncbi:hypothetical protein LB503_008756, partial [Fusarium chuoi]